LSRIPDHIIEQVREAHEIVEIVRRSVSLKQAGAGFKGLCPFHDEKTPSFTVSPTRQTYKCFGCGKGGNVFGFLMETSGLNFPEAVRQLADERGIVIPDDGPADPALDQRYERIREALKFAHRYFVGVLASEDGAEARRYLAKRGYDDAACHAFGLGCAPPPWDRLITAARAQGISERALDEAGLIVPRKAQSGGGTSGFYDRFRHRVMFPIADARGRLATFAGRTLDPDDPAKYMNGPETDVFKKTNILYMLHRARDPIRKRGEALLMEGYTDVLMCQMHGFDHAIAGMGTAFTEPQARHLHRLAERVTLLYDSDNAGRMAAEKALDMLLLQGLEVRIALLPEGRDVDEILLEEGPEALQAILDASLDLFDFKLGLLAERLDLATPRGRAKAAEDIVATIAKVQSPIERDQLLRMVAERLGGGPETEAVLRRQMADRSRKQHPRRQQPGTNRSAPPARATLGDHLERASASLQERCELDLLAGALLLQGMRDAIFRAAGPEEFTAPARERLYNALLARWEQGREIEAREVHTQFQADAEVVTVIAGLPELESPRGGTLEERVTSWIATTEQQRLQIHHQREIVRLARGGRMPDAEVDPDASFYGEETHGEESHGEEVRGGMTE